MQRFDTFVGKLGYSILNFLIVLSLFVFATNINVKASVPHVVISEIQVGETGHAENEFVELYNPTNSDIDMTGCRLTRKTGTGGTTNNLINSMSGVISSHGYYLIAHATGYLGSATPDATYSTASLANNNTVILYSDAGITPVDEVGMGTAINFEGTAAGNPANGQSIERKANSISTAISMEIGGIDEFLGNGQDTDNNLNDFVVRSIPQPQNSQSDIEPSVSTPSPSPSPTPTASSTATPTAEPTIEPTLSPSPTPSESPTEVPTPTPTTQPTAIPTLTPRPTHTPKPKHTEYRCYKYEPRWTHIFPIFYSHGRHEDYKHHGWSFWNRD